MQKTYQEWIQLRTRDCDRFGQWKPSAVLEAMQDAAGQHSTLLGCGRETLVEKGIVWVITRCETRFETCPSVLDRVQIETFPMPLRHWLFPRYFIFRDAEGNRLGAASTFWVLFDLKNRCMLEPGEVARAIPDNSDLTPPIGAPGSPKRLQGQEHVSARMPAFCELDVNGHVNNARYADWLLDALGLETLQEFSVQTLRVNYASEILPGRQIALKLVRDGLAFYFTGSHEGKLCFEIGGTLQKRAE